MLRNLLNKASSPRALSRPTLEDELGDHKAYPNGKILNAGTGISVDTRDITFLSVVN